MTWLKVDDSLAFHPKVIAAGNPALGLWVRAGAWSAQQLTDGHVHAEIAASLGTAAQAQALVRVGLWLPNGSGFVFHDWDQFNPSRLDVLDRRRASAERLRKWRESRGNGDGSDA